MDNIGERFYFVSYLTDGRRMLMFIRNVLVCVCASGTFRVAYFCGRYSTDLRLYPNNITL